MLKPGLVRRYLRWKEGDWYNAEAQYALDLAVEMQRRGHRVTFFTQAGSPVARRGLEAGVETGEEAGLGPRHKSRG